MNDAVQAITEELNDLAESLEGIERMAGPSTGFSRAGRLFATADAGGFEFLVGDLIAGAALRTPDVMPGSRGSGWVRFAPSELDQPALDRALSWFEAAWRRAEG